MLTLLTLLHPLCLLPLLLLPATPTLTQADLLYPQALAPLASASNLSLLPHTLGLSSLQLPITALFLTPAPNPTYTQLKGSPIILLTSVMHAREDTAFIFMKKAIQRIIGLYGDGDEEMKYLLTRVVLVVVPIVNVDGVGKGWRKNGRGGGCGRGERGVDVNRNFGYSFGSIDTSADPCGEQYRGKAPFSQPQSQAIRQLYLDFHVLTNIDIHSYGNTWIYPYASNPNPNAITDSPLYPLYNLTFTHFAKLNIAYASCYQSLQYIADGVYIDWALEQGSLSYALEFGVGFEELGEEMEKHLEGLRVVLRVSVGYWEYWVREGRLCVRVGSNLGHGVGLQVDSQLLETMTLKGSEPVCFAYNLSSLPASANLSVHLTNSSLWAPLPQPLPSSPTALPLHPSVPSPPTPLLDLLAQFKYFFIITGALYLIGSLCGLSICCQRALGMDIHKSSSEQQSRVLGRVQKFEMVEVYDQYGNGSSQRNMSMEQGQINKSQSENKDVK